MSQAAAFDYALRVVLAAACVIHGILDVADPLIGAKSSALKIENSIPRWLLPCAGALRVVAAFALFSDNAIVVLVALAYTCMLWSGAVLFHLRRKHHPATALPAAMFVLLIFTIALLRLDFLVAFVATASCITIGVGLGQLLVTPQSVEEGRVALNE
jgi:hypothetical protein